MEKTVYLYVDCLMYYDKKENEFFYLSHGDDISKPVIKPKYLCVDDVFTMSTEWLPNIEADATKLEFFDRTHMYIKNKIEDITEALGTQDAYIFVKPNKSI